MIDTDLLKNKGILTTEQPTAASAGYAPSVGDCFYKPAGTQYNSITDKTLQMPEQTATVTMVSHGHVVAVINNLEMTFPIADFIRLAQKTVSNGATLTRRA